MEQINLPQIVKNAKRVAITDLIELFELEYKALQISHPDMARGVMLAIVIASKSKMM
jgi:hypothetical protein